MNNRNLLSSVLIFMLIFCMACEEPLDNYVHLEYSDFMKLSNDEIADSLSIILNVAPVTYKQVVSLGMFYFDNLKWSIKEGYEYIANDSAKITIWVDEENKPYYVTYFLKRKGSAADWTYEEDSAISNFKSIIEKSGSNLTGLEKCNLDKEYWGTHWYSLRLVQNYIDTCVDFPYFYSETESDTNKVNFLLINRWYTNLDDITDILSEQSLKEKAREYFENSEKVDSIPEELTVEGYHVIEDKLCRKIGSAIIDKYGSRLFLYIDVQNGEVIGEEALYVG